MPRRDSEEEDDALSPPGFSTPTKVIRNDGAGHAEPDAEGTESESDADVEKEFDESTGKKRNYTGYQKYRFIKQWVTGPEAVLEDTEIQHEIYTEMKKFMHASGLKKTPGHKPKETDIHLWKQYSKAYRNNRTGDWTRPFRCPLRNRCGCQAQVKHITGDNFIRLEFSGTHDENSHAEDKSKKLKHNQIVVIHESVLAAPNQSATKLRRNLAQATGSPESHKHMAPSLIRHIQRRVRTARDQLTKQVLDVEKVPESMGELTDWCDKNDFYAALARHNNPTDSFCMPLFSTLVIGSDIKAERQVIHINFSSVWLLLNAVRAIETGWVVQLNGDATFGFCCADIDMIALGFCSFGGANNPVCFSYIPRQSEGEKLYTVTYFGMQKAVMSLLKANTEKDCEFTSCLKLLLGRPHVQQYLDSDEFRANKLPIDQAQCDQLAGWACFSREVFGRDPNVCSNHLTGMHRLRPAPFRN